VAVLGNLVAASFAGDGSRLARIQAANVGGVTASRALVSDAAGNVSISTVTATELSYVGGVVSGIQGQLNAKYANGNAVVVAVGSVGAPSLAFTGRTSTGIFSPDADTIAIAAGGVERLRTNAASGNVSVTGNIVTTGNVVASGNVVATTFWGDGSKLTGVGVSGLTPDRTLVSSAGGAVTTSGVTATELNYVGGVVSGIQGQLNAKYANGNTVVAHTGSAATPSLTFTGRTSTGIFSPSANVLAIATQGTERLRVDATGNVAVIGNLVAASFAGDGSRLARIQAANVGGITASRALVSDANGNVAASGVTASELGYVGGVVSGIQGQLDAKYANGNTVVAHIGSAATPSLTFTERTETGIFSPVANVLAIATQGTERLRVDADGTVSVLGNVTVSSIAGDGSRVYGVHAANVGGIMASHALISDANGNIGVSVVTTTELGYLHGVTSGLQSQLDAKYANGNAVVVAVGSVGAPGLAFTGRTSTGVFSPDVDTIALTAGGIERLRTDAASGNVALTGNAVLTGNLHASNVYAGNVIATTLYGDGSKLTGISGGVSGLTPARALISSEGGTVTTSTVTGAELGYVSGVTSGIQTQLDSKFANGGTVVANIGSTTIPGLTFTGRATTGIYSPGVDMLAITAGGVERLRANAAAGNVTITGNIVASANVIAFGNIGVKTTAPTEPLHVVGNILSTRYIGGTGTTSAPTFSFSGRATTGLYSAAVNTLSLSVNGTQRLQCNDSGVSVIGALSATTSLAVGLGGISTTGDITAFSSDARLKTNLRPVVTTTSALDAVAQLRGVRFDWREDTPQPHRGTDVGLIAQDVANVIPEAVAPAPFDNSYLTIRIHHQLTALLVEAIKELRERVRVLEAEGSCLNL
jgi:hypothetical protein